MSAELQIHQTLGLRLWLTNRCDYFDPGTNTYCNAVLPQSGIWDANRIIVMLARASPVSRAPDLPPRHGLSFIETLRRLACNVNCTKHQHPTIQARSITSWLHAAAEAPILFAFSAQLELSLRRLHITIPYLAETVEPQRWRPRLIQLLQDLEDKINEIATTNSLEQMILTTMDEMFDPYFQNFAQNVLLEVVHQLIHRGRQNSNMSPPPPIHTASQNPILRFYRWPAIYERVVSPTSSIDMNLSPGSSAESSPTSLDFEPHSSPPSLSPSSSSSSIPTIPPRSFYRNSWTVPSLHHDHNHDQPSSSSSSSASHNDLCPICLNPFHSLSRTRKCSTCPYFFHIRCMALWARESGGTDGAERYTTCPCCRSHWRDFETREFQLSRYARVGDLRRWAQRGSVELEDVVLQSEVGRVGVVGWVGEGVESGSGSGSEMEEEEEEEGEGEGEDGVEG